MIKKPLVLLVDNSGYQNKNYDNTNKCGNEFIVYKKINSTINTNLHPHMQVQSQEGHQIKILKQNDFNLSKKYLSSIKRANNYMPNLSTQDNNTNGKGCGNEINANVFDKFKYEDSCYKEKYNYKNLKNTHSSSTTTSSRTDKDTYVGSDKSSAPSTTSQTSAEINTALQIMYYNSSSKLSQEKCDLTEKSKAVIKSRISKHTIETVSWYTKTVIPCKPLSKPSNKLISLEKFILNLIESSRVNMGTLLCTLVYLAKLKKTLPAGSQGQECTSHRIFLAALILAGKYLNDSSPKNKYWARYSGIFSLKEVNLMEKQFLDFLDLNEVSELFWLQNHSAKISNFLQNLSLHKISFSSNKTEKPSSNLQTSGHEKKIKT
ncbi:hypothetical protein BB561_001953 [Smittium simulii]|uniref:Cyclin N-terminal domain-containing protein n=1 Tax=Smittium simulii TaxID=133385 RepID=A0A2T9YSD0_9FUNG|nr:hypothetical protein BB561_001953 [Smittium simulii]